jgi:hypothetical protein
MRYHRSCILKPLDGESLHIGDPGCFGLLCPIFQLRVICSSLLCSLSLSIPANCSNKVQHRSVT